MLLYFTRTQQRTTMLLPPCRIPLCIVRKDCITFSAWKTVVLHVYRPISANASISIVHTVSYVIFRIVTFIFLDTSDLSVSWLHLVHNSFSTCIVQILSDQVIVMYFNILIMPVDSDAPGLFFVLPYREVSTGCGAELWYVGYRQIKPFPTPKLVSGSCLRCCSNDLSAIVLSGIHRNLIFNYILNLGYLFRWIKFIRWYESSSCLDPLQRSVDLRSDP